MGRRKRTPKEEVNQKKEQLVQRLLCTDTRLFFALKRDKNGNVLPLEPNKQAIADDLSEKIRILNSTKKLTPTMRRW